MAALWFEQGVEPDELPEAVAEARAACEETGAALAEAADAQVRRTVQVL
jgi:hypothetical protein